MDMSGVQNAVPLPSGGLESVSVNNNSLENVTEDKLTTLVFPCNKGPLQHDYLKPADFVFVMREKIGEVFEPQVKFQPAYNRSNGVETALVSLPTLNQIIRDEAIAHYQQHPDKPHWTQDVNLVAEWATPFGAVLNTARTGTMNGRTGHPGKHFTRDAVNVCVSRRATVKNNFYSASRGSTLFWSSTNMDSVAVQYSLEKIVHLAAPERTELNVVVVSMVLLDCNEIQTMCNCPGSTFDGIESCCRGEGEQLVIDVTNGKIPSEQQAIENEAKYTKKPIHKEALLIPIGRVLHSAPRNPTAHEALRSCISKNVYDNLGPIEILLGCP